MNWRAFIIWRICIRVISSHQIKSYFNQASVVPNILSLRLSILFNPNWRYSTVLPMRYPILETYSKLMLVTIPVSNLSYGLSPSHRYGLASLMPQGLWLSPMGYCPSLSYGLSLGPLGYCPSVSPWTVSLNVTIHWSCLYHVGFRLCYFAHQIDFTSG